MNWGGYPNQNFHMFQAEVEALLKTYFEIYSNTSSLCLFKWPLYVDHAMPVGRIAIANPATLTERDTLELNQMLNIAETTRTNPQPGTKGVITVGLDMIGHKIDNDFKLATELERSLIKDIEEPLREAENRLNGDFLTRIAKIKEKNFQLLEKTLKVEEKLQFFAKRTNTFDVKVSTATEMENILSDCAASVDDFERKTDSLRYFSDQRHTEFSAQNEENNRLSNEKLITIMKKKDKNYLLDYLEKMKAGVEALKNTVNECEQEAKELIQISER